MLRRANNTWERYIAGIERRVDLYDPPFPDNLEYVGPLAARTDYVPSNEFLQALRSWLLDRNEGRLYYFLTEAVRGEETAFQIEAQDLHRETLVQINPGYCNLFVAEDFSWAIFINDEGEIHVAGNGELFKVLTALFDAPLARRPD